MATYFGHRTKWQGGTKHQTGGSNPRGWNYPPPGPRKQNYNRSSYGKTITLDKGEYQRVKPRWAQPTNPKWSGALKRAQAARFARKLAWWGTKAAFKVNPYARAANFAWDFYDAMQQGDWAYSRTETVDVDPYVDAPAGWEMTCGVCYAPELGPWRGFVNTSLCETQVCRPAIAGSGPEPELNWSQEGDQTASFDGNVRQSFGTWFTNHSQSWQKTGPGPAGLPQIRTTADVRASPLPMPSLRPPLPESAERGKNAPRPAAKPKPYEEPATEIAITPRGPVVNPPVIHKNLPPSRKVKEKKYVLNYGAAGKIYGALTESNDAAEAIIDAMGKKNPCRRERTLHGKWLCILNNAEKIDWPQALVNLATEQAQDYIIGKFGQLQKRGVQNAAEHGYYNNPRGLGSGGWSWRHF